MQDVAERLISAEFHSKNRSDTKGGAALRVVERLRQRLSRLIGVTGFRSLFSRAWKLAIAEPRWLAGLRFDSQESLEFTPKLETSLSQEEIAQDGAAVITQLLQLLVTFIGETLTLRLVYDIWPKAAASGHSLPVRRARA